MVRLYATGTVGSTNGMKWIYNAPSQNDIDGDNDGVMTPNHSALIDLSDLSSQLLGQQVTQSASYTIRRIWISMRNKDDVIDNDESTYFAGTLRWFYPTQHKQAALGLARAAEKAIESISIDADSLLLSTETDYTAVRFGWDSEDAAGFESDQVRFGTAEGFDEIGGTEWSLKETFRVYNQMHPATKMNSLFGGRAGNMTCKIPWSTSAATGVGVGDAPARIHDWNSGAISARVLAGLVLFNVAHSSLDEEGETDDDYEMVVGIEYDVGVDA